MYDVMMRGAHCHQASTGQSKMERLAESKQNEKDRTRILQGRYVDDYGMRGIKQTKDMTAFGNSEDYPNPYGVLFI